VPLSEELRSFLRERMNSIGRPRWVFLCDGRRKILADQSLPVPTHRVEERTVRLRIVQALIDDNFSDKFGDIKESMCPWLKWAAPNAMNWVEQNGWETNSAILFVCLLFHNFISYSFLCWLSRMDAVI